MAAGTGGGNWRRELEAGTGGGAGVGRDGLCVHLDSFCGVLLVEALSSSTPNPLDSLIQKVSRSRGYGHLINTIS